MLESVTVLSRCGGCRALVYIAERLKVLTETAASCTLRRCRASNGRLFAREQGIVLISCGGNQSIIGHLRIFIANSESKPLRRYQRNAVPVLEVRRPLSFTLRPELVASVQEYKRFLPHIEAHSYQKSTLFITRSRPFRSMFRE